MRYGCPKLPTPETSHGTKSMEGLSPYKTEEKYWYLNCSIYSNDHWGEINMLYFFMMLFCMESFYSMAWLIAWNDVNI